jgi:hypothetical protein
MMKKVFNSGNVVLLGGSDPEIMGVRVREFPVEADKDQNTADLQNPTSRAANGKVAEPAAFVQIDKHGIQTSIPPLPKTSMHLLQALHEPERCMKWLEMSFILDSESEMNFKVRSVRSAYVSTYQDNPPQLPISDLYQITRKVFKGGFSLGCPKDPEFTGLRAREFPFNGTRDVNPVAPGGVANGSGSGMREVSTGASESDSDGSVIARGTSGAPVHAQVISAKKRNPGMGIISPVTDPRILGVAMATESATPPGHRERTNDQYMAQMNSVVNIMPRSPEYHTPQSNVPLVRPPEQHRHMYQGIITGGTSRTYASSRADIMNYSEPREDLDWTRVTDLYERKRMQNLINGRKYRERMLAIDGKCRSGGNYPGASGVGGRISTGYGPRRGSGQQEEPYAVQNLRSSLEYHSASREDAVGRASPKPKEED